MKVLAYVGMFAAISSVVSGCRSSEPARTASVETVRARIVKSEQVVAPASLKATGTLHARESAILSAQVTGGYSRFWFAKEMLSEQDRRWWFWMMRP